jgi:hypothetical protein
MMRRSEHSLSHVRQLNNNKAETRQSGFSSALSYQMTPSLLLSKVVEVAWPPAHTESSCRQLAEMSSYTFEALGTNAREGSGSHLRPARVCVPTLLYVA